MSFAKPALCVKNVAIVAREGLQTGVVVKAWENVMPLLFRRSKLGVNAPLCLVNEGVHAPWSSVMIKMILGFVANAAADSVLAAAWPKAVSSMTIELSF